MNRFKMNIWIFIRCLSIWGMVTHVEGTVPSRSIITPEDAFTFAVNNLEPVKTGFRLSHPSHLVDFTQTGVNFKPRLGGPTWHWHLERITTGPFVLGDIAPKAMPEQPASGVVSYDRHGLVERYFLSAISIEQQFVIPGPLPLSGENLVVEGAIESDGQFETSSQGWLWRTDDGVVSLRDVTVYDADGQVIPATMTTTSTGTRIEVDGPALALAAYPVLTLPRLL
jgi:hypothetical protein